MCEENGDTDSERRVHAVFAFIMRTSQCLCLGHLFHAHQGHLCRGNFS